MYENIPVSPVVQEEILLQANLITINLILKNMIMIKASMECDPTCDPVVLEWANLHIGHVLCNRRQLYDQINACRLQLRVN